jgi:5-(carboxyamino)imidazole ribonucleotide synthase
MPRPPRLPRAQAVDVVSFEFENIPVAAAEFLAERVAVRPRPEVLRICQNRLREKDFCGAAGVPTARYGEASGPQSLTHVARGIGLPCVLKTTEMGYDGRGQVLLSSEADLEAAWPAMAGGDPEAVGIVEAFVDFALEISVIVARGADGACRTYPAVENQHRKHILDQTIVPARVPQEVADRAEGIALTLAEKLNLVGLLAIEMFVTQDQKVLVNELAPRPHNSGHWTIDACVTSQFEQFVRAVAGLPLGSTERHADAVMKNLLGEEANRWREILTDPAAKLHLYGKAEVRPGRKMGHVTRLTPRE